MVKFASQNCFKQVEFFVQYVGFMRGVNIKGVSNQTFTLTGFLQNIKQADHGLEFKRTRA